MLLPFRLISLEDICTQLKFIKHIIMSAGDCVGGVEDLPASTSEFRLISRARND